MNATKPSLIRSQIRAEEVQVGDRLDASGKTRVAQRHDRKNDQGPATVMVRTQTRGARSPSIRSWPADKIVMIWRPTTTDVTTEEK